MHRLELGRRIYDASHLTGDFDLRSGRRSNTYFDTYQFEGRPDILKELIIPMSTLIPYGTEVLAGIELGGVPIATVLSLHTGIPMAIVRPSRKEYGRRRIVEGFDVKDKKVCLVENVITSGGQTIFSAKAVMEEGAASVEYVICVVERTSDGRQKLREAGLWLNSFFKQSELEDIAKRENDRQS